MRGRAQFVFDFEAPLKTVGGDKGFAVEILVRAVVGSSLVCSGSRVASLRSQGDFLSEADEDVGKIAAMLVDATPSAANLSAIQKAQSRC